MDFYFLQQLNFKKILLVVVFIAICLGLAYGMYYLFFKPNETSNLVPINNVEVVSLPVGSGGGNNINQNNGSNTGNSDNRLPVSLTDLPIANGGETYTAVIFADPVVGADVAASGRGVNFYNAEDNKFYFVSEDGEKTLLSNKEFYQVKDVYWSADKNKAIIEYPDGNKILYDFTKSSQLTLSPSIEEPSFDSNNRVAYKYVSDNLDDNWLTVSKIDGTETTLVEPIGDNGEAVQVAWSPTGEIVAFYSQPIGNNESEIYFLGLKGENFKSLKVAGTNFKGMWSPSGARMIYSVVSGDNNYNPMLYVVDAEGDTIGAHKFSLGLTTWVDKCVFATETVLYCAVPKSLMEGAGLYPEAVTDIEDLIYRIDLTTGLKDLIAEPIDANGKAFNIGTMYLSANDGSLFLLNKNDNRIYRLRLK